MARTAAAGDRFGDEEAVRSIVTEALRGLPVRIFLFGSRARREARPGADIDVALLSRAPIPRHVLSRLREELEESNILASVDVVDLSETSPALREEVLREGREWTVSHRA